VASGFLHADYSSGEEVDMRERDIAIARDLIGLALTEPKHGFLDSDSTGLLELLDAVEGADVLIGQLRSAHPDDVIRIAGGLLSTMAESVAEAEGGRRSGRDVLRWYAESFAQGSLE
jgi:hypothetical protein